MASQQTQYYRSGLQIGNQIMPVYPTVRFSAPKNFAVPPIVGNSWQFTEGDGLQQATIDVQMVVRDFAGEALSLGFLNLFLTRDPSDVIANDTYEIPNGIIVWNGRRAMQLNHAKADSFTLSTSKGDDLRLSARFCGADFEEVDIPSPYEWNSARLLRFNKVYFQSGTVFENKVWSFNASYSNNHNPDMSLNGTPFPAAQNAGMRTAGLQVTVQAVDDIAIGGTMSSDGSGTQVGGVPTQAVFTVEGNNLTTNFKFQNIESQSPNDLTVQVPRNMRAHSFLCKGLSGNNENNAPLVVY